MLEALRNPLTEYLLYVARAVRGRLEERDLRLHYLASYASCQLESNVTLFSRAQVSDSRIGRHTYVGAGSRVHLATIGRFCAIGPGCRIGLGRHPTHTFVSSHPIFYSTSPHTGPTFADHDYFAEHVETTIGHDVWIGAGAMVLDGASVGDGAIIGAGAVVKGEVPPYAIVGGVPATVLRHRFDEETIRLLLAQRWWDRDDDWLRQNFQAFHDIAAFRRMVTP